MIQGRSGEGVITERNIETDFVVVGGGLSGVCAALAAARHGARVVLAQDRSVLGGNASSEIRMGIMGAYGDDNKETGLLEELQLENLYYNPLRRYTRWDDVLYSAVVREPGITLLLDTSVWKVEARENRILAVEAWNSNEYCRYRIAGKLFADCSGDGILRLSGAEYRIGRGGRNEFGESHAPEHPDRFTMGNSLLLQLRKCGEHRPFLPPPWAYHYTDETVPKGRNLFPDNNNFWWIEYGGVVDVIADAGAIRQELKKVAYGIWEYMKNHPDGRCRNYELDWIGSLPGKRESTRFVGDHMLTQDDVLAGGDFKDAIGHGGWPLDDHDPLAIHNPELASRIYDTPSPFGIPYRSLYSKNIENLFFAGRNISATHMGMSTTRVMATCAVLGQAVGTAAALALRSGSTPRGIYQDHLAELQDILQEDDQFIHNRPRRIAPLTLEASVTSEALRNGMDRRRGDADNGAWIGVGGCCVCEWKEPRRVSGCRVVFDTELSAMGKRMLKLEAQEVYTPMPPVLTRRFRLEAETEAGWLPLAAEENNIRRLWRKEWPPVETRRVRLTVEGTWGAEKAHLFSFEVR